MGGRPLPGSQEETRCLPLAHIEVPALGTLAAKKHARIPASLHRVVRHAQDHKCVVGCKEWHSNLLCCSQMWCVCSVRLQGRLVVYPCRAATGTTVQQIPTGAIKTCLICCWCWVVAGLSLCVVGLEWFGCGWRYQASFALILRSTHQQKSCVIYALPCLVWL